MFGVLDASSFSSVYLKRLFARLLCWAVVLIRFFTSCHSASPAAVNMPETAESHSYTLNTNRNCTVEITNVSSGYCLVNPK